MKTSPLVRTLVIRISLAVQANMSKVLQNLIALKLPVLPDQVQYSVMASRTSYQAYWKGLDQYFSTFVRPWPAKLFFYKTRSRSQQIYS